MKPETISGVKKMTDTGFSFKAHPLIILTYLKPYMFILLIPTAQGVASYFVNRKLTSLILGEFLTAAVILTLSILKFLRFRMTIRTDHITVQQGILLRNTARIPIDKISTAFVRTGPLLILCRAVEIRLNTEAGRPGKADFKMIMPRTIVPKLYGLFPFGKSGVTTLETTAKRLIIMAAATSNFATGLLIAAPVVDHAGDLLGTGITEKVYDTINVAVEYAESTIGSLIPPIAGYIAAALLIGFAISFVVSVFKNLPFKMQRRGEYIIAIAGTIIKRRIFFKAKSVNSVSVIQNPFMMLFRRYNVGISVAGYGDSRGETAMIIPAAEPDKVYSLIGQILPQVNRCELQIRHPENTLRNFCTPPAIILITVPLAAAILSKLFVHFSGLIWFLAFVAELFDLLLFVLAVLRFQRTGIAMGGDFCVVGLRWFSIVEFHCPEKNVGMIRVTQYPWDRKSALCRVKVTVRSENAESLNVALLAYDQVKEKIEALYHLNIA